jgi:hypothetical protein
MMLLILPRISSENKKQGQLPNWHTEFCYQTDNVGYLFSNWEHQYTSFSNWCEKSFQKKNRFKKKFDVRIEIVTKQYWMSIT